MNLFLEAASLIYKMFVIFGTVLSGKVLTTALPVATVKNSNPYSATGTAQSLRQQSLQHHRDCTV